MKGKPAPTPYLLVVTIAADRRAPIYSDVLNQYRTLQPIRLRQQITLRP